jgi:hypothetical protein
LLCDDDSPFNLLLFFFGLPSFAILCDMDRCSISSQITTIVTFEPVGGCASSRTSVEAGKKLQQNNNTTTTQQQQHITPPPTTPNKTEQNFLFPPLFLERPTQISCNPQLPSVTRASP